MLQTAHSKTIAEVTYDKTWRTGIPLDSPDAVIEEKWYIKGWMSDILTAIRDQDMYDFH